MKNIYYSRDLKQRTCNLKDKEIDVAGGMGSGRSQNKGENTSSACSTGNFFVSEVSWSLIA